MITQEEYLKALNVVELYHEQLNLSIIRHSGNDRDISQLKKGEYIRLVKNVNPIPKNFTLGKKYKILDANDRRGLQIRHDNDGVYWIPISNVYKRWGI